MFAIVGLICLLVDSFGVDGSRYCCAWILVALFAEVSLTLICLFLLLCLFTVVSLTFGLGFIGLIVLLVICCA